MQTTNVRRGKKLVQPCYPVDVKVVHTMKTTHLFSLLIKSKAHLQL